MMRKFLWGMVIACLAVANPAHAFRMSPIEIEFDATGAGASQSVTLDNPGETPMAVEITIHDRDMNPEGEDILQPAGDRFLAVPSQVILMPGDRQIVRVQWTGGSVPQEKAFRMVAEQLPIDLGKAQSEGGRVKLLVRYVASLYVKAPGAKPELQMMGASLDKAEDGGSVLSFRVANPGKAHLGLNNLTIHVKNGQGAEIFKLEPSQLENVTGAVVLPGRERQFRVPLAEPRNSEPVTVELDYGSAG